MGGGPAMITMTQRALPIETEKGLEVSNSPPPVTGSRRQDVRLAILAGRVAWREIIASDPSSPRPLAPAPRCDPWAPHLSILSVDGLHLTYASTALDRKSVVKGKRASVRVDLGGRRIYKKKNETKTKKTKE